MPGVLVSDSPTVMTWQVDLKHVRLGISSLRGKEHLVFSADLSLPKNDVVEAVL